MPELTPVEVDQYGVKWFAEEPIDGHCPQCGSRVELHHTTDRAYVGAVPSYARCFDCDWSWSE